MEEYGMYRAQSRRLQHWDYASPGMYFVTICTRKKFHYFGSITNGELHLSSMGQIVDQEWNKTAALRPYVSLDAYLVMPNHLHGILALQSFVETPRWGVLHPGDHKPCSLGNIIGQFKAACTRRIRQDHDRNFAWQSRYFDHVIRDETDLQRIRQYIQDNPKKWMSDKYFCRET